MDHFRVLPTMREYQELSEEQIDILFLYHVMRPTDEQLREYYRQEVHVQQVQETLPVDLLRSRGYTEEQIQRIREALPLAAGG